MDAKAAYSVLGAYRASLRKKGPKVCRTCGGAFTGIKKAIYCSPRCRMRAFREAQRGLTPDAGDPYDRPPGAEGG